MNSWEYGEIVIGLASGAHQFTLSRELVGFVLYKDDSRTIDASIKPEEMKNINNLNEQEVEILIIEDNPGDAELTIRALKKSHVANHIIHLVDGAEALDFLFGTGEYSSRNLDNLPKVILLDLKMPKVDGLEVLRHLKSDLRTKMIPVVILTSSAKDPDIKKCYDLGANSYIVKPVEINNFVKTVSEIGMYWLLIDKGNSEDHSLD